VTGPLKYEDWRVYLECRAAAYHPSMARWFDFDELVAEGWLALEGASRRWGASKGAQLASYADRRVRGAMLDMRRWIVGRPSRGIPPAPRYMELAEGAAGTVAASRRPEHRDEVAHLLRGLSRAERLILMLKHGEELPVRDVAQAVGCSQTRIHQIEAARRGRVGLG